MNDYSEPVASNGIQQRQVGVPIFYRFARQVRRRLFMILVGVENGKLLEKSLHEYRRLAKFEPNNTVETFMTKPSDIWEHLATLHMLIVENNLTEILELGTAEGESTVVLLEAARIINGRVYSVDINSCHEAQDTIKTYGLSHLFSFIQENDLKLKWDKRIDFLFIDTSHNFEHTLQELQKYEPYVRNGGIIALHDIISFPEVMEAIASYLKNRNDLRLYKHLHNNGLAIIFKGEKL